jgi:hypothetical protein
MCAENQNLISSPRERCLAALAEARDAQAKYVDFLQKERAEQARVRERERSLYGACLVDDLDAYCASVVQQPEGDRLGRRIRQKEEDHTPSHPVIQRLTTEFSAILTDFMGVTKGSEPPVSRHTKYAAFRPRLHTPRA